MISYFRIFLLFVIPAYLALSIGYFYTYNETVEKIISDYKSAYEKAAESYAYQFAELDKSYEKIMKAAALGIKEEIQSENISTENLKKIASKYQVTHLFIINKKGKFVKSTNEDPEKIPNLFSFSNEYRRLIGKNDLSFLTTPVITPMPEKIPHKFLVIWDQDYFIEIGFRITEIAKTLESMLRRDPSIIAAVLSNKTMNYSIERRMPRKDEHIIRTKKSINIENYNYAQSTEDSTHTFDLAFDISSTGIDSSIASIRNRYIINFFLTILLTTLLLSLATKLLRKKVKLITSHLSHLAKDGDFYKSLKILSRNEELNNLISAINNLLQSYRTSTEKTIQTEKEAVHKSLTLQVAHDIRSPLEALKSCKSELSKLPEADRITVNLALNRIEEIALNLLTSNKEEKENFESAHLWTLIQQIITEKTAQYRDKENLNIVFTAVDSFEAFSHIRPSSLKRVISNLISNSAEATNFEGVIKVIVQKQNQFAVIKIEDNGPGINPSIRKNLFAKGATTKATGNGLGLYYSKVELQKVGGDIRLANADKTTFEILLPLAQTPVFFPIELPFNEVNTVLILDDDENIHNVWKKRLSDFPVHLKHYFSSETLLSDYRSLPSDTFLLSDYDLREEQRNGWDCITLLNACDRSILVTSEFNLLPPPIFSSGTKILPKILASQIPINIRKFDREIVLIDDDYLIQYSWKSKAKLKGINVHCYNSIEEFIKTHNSISLITPIYLDSNLKNGVVGEVESEKLHTMGFANLYLATCYDKESISKPKWIKEIYSKFPEHIFA